MDLSNGSAQRSDANAAISPELVAKWQAELEWRMRLERPEYDDEQFDALIQRMMRTVADDSMRAMEKRSV